MGICIECDKLKCEVCSSMGRHPAGKYVQSPEELGWALATAGRLGEQRAEKRIIDLLEAERAQCEKAGLFANGPELREQLQTAYIGLELAITLIKGENK